MGIGNCGCQEQGIFDPKSCLCKIYNFAFEECLKKVGSWAVRARGSAALKLPRQLEILSIVLKNIVHYSQKYCPVFSKILSDILWILSIFLGNIVQRLEILSIIVKIIIQAAGNFIHYHWRYFQWSLKYCTFPPKILPSRWKYFWGHLKCC